MHRLVVPSLLLLAIVTGCSPAEPASPGSTAIETTSAVASSATVPSTSASPQASPVIAPQPQSDASAEVFANDASSAVGVSSPTEEETSSALATADVEEPTTEVSTPAPATGGWRSLLDAVDPTRDAVAGSWTKIDEGLRVAAATGARLAIPGALPDEYDVRVTATRTTGQHSLAIFFPHGSGQASFEVDAWGRHLGGIQNVGGRSIQENRTRTEDVALENGRRCTMVVEVRRNSVLTYLDGRLIGGVSGDGSDLSVPDLWRMPDRDRLGIGAWESETIFHSIEVRAVAAPAAEVAPSPAASAVASTVPTSSSSESPARVEPSVEEPAPPTPSTPAPAASGPAGKRVLIVIANYDFFYREYGDPRQELERAGVEVAVAAGRRERCTPHGGSGQGADGGVVMADVAIRDAKADDYDAILFSGGWGASAYQYAFEGRYDQRQYNGDQATKTAVNRLIGDFLEQDKHVAALCNGVTVLAWARVDGKSPLDGKRVCAPTRQAASGIYDGQPAQPSCRWHPERNGAILSPAGAIGQPGTPADDVMVDGLIVTGEDDISAREMGRTLVRLLSE